MAKEYAKAFYNSEAWKKTRKAYYDSKGGMCERCQKEFEEGKRSLKEVNIGTIVHHKKWITPKNINDPRITLDFRNLELLCIDCHNKEHSSKQTKRYQFVASGNVIPPTLPKNKPPTETGDWT